jgi:hypothetical protein
MRTAVVRFGIRRLLRQAPFQPFVLDLENGDRIAIEHPEDIAFDPGSDGPDSGSKDFYVISGRLRVSSTFEAVTRVALADTEGQIPSGEPES